MLECEYKELMEQVTPCPTLRERTVERMLEEDWKRAPSKPRKARRAVTAALACVLVMALSVTALASAVPGFRELLFGKGSPVAESLTPVAAEGEWDGIRMEVLGAMGDKNNVTAYFTLQDTEGKNRLSGDMEVYVSARLNNEYPEAENAVDGGMGRCTSVLEYSEETQTALCRFNMVTGKYRLPDSIAVMSDEPYDATNAKIELRVRKIATNSGSLDYVPLNFSAEELTTETLPVVRVHCGGLAFEEGVAFETAQGFLTIEEAEAERGKVREWTGENAPEDHLPPMFEHFQDESGAPVVLKPGEALPVDGPDFAQITAVGFIDGKLHIQYKYYGYRQDGENQNITVICADAGQGAATAEKLAEYAKDPSNSLNAGEVSRLQTYKLLDEPGLFDLDEAGQAQWNAGYSVDSGMAEYCYWELVFDIGPEDLEDHEFFAIAGRSENTTVNISAEPFVLEKSLPENTASFGSVKGDGFSVETVDVTPMGVYLTGTRKGMENITGLEFLCGDETRSYHAVGMQGMYRGSVTVREDNEAVMKFVTDGAPVDPREITAIRINGEEIPLA